MDNIILLSSVSSNVNWIIMIAIYAGVIGASYFFCIRPQRKEKKRIECMLSTMSVGDAVVTTSGFYGIVVDITGDDCVIEFGSNKNCRIPMQKRSIAMVEKSNV